MVDGTDEAQGTGGTRVHVTGLVDGGWARRIAEVLRRAPGPVLIDLTDAILVSRSPLSDVLRKAVASGRDLSQVSIVCPRVSAMMLLRRWGITEFIAVNPEAGEPPDDQESDEDRRSMPA
jgi:hypothetical protein